MPKNLGAASPTKRRKTRGNLVTRSTKASWPANELPVELFALIIAYLPRSNIQNMRLVNKEFEEKVAQVLFRTVVVPFKPEIYGISSDTVTANDGQSCIMLQDKGMRVFQGFGRWIQKFAMSFEIDQNRLTNPPVKSDQEAITTFWGIYRWPFKSYNRYTQLEGLEQTADETRSMAKALRFITNAEELGLSIDGGLGWMPGPDINSRVIARGDKLSVFGSSRFVPEPKPRQSRAGSSSLSLQASNGGAYRDVRRIVEEAGYTGDELHEAIRNLLENEGVDVPPPADGYDPPSQERTVRNAGGFRHTSAVRRRSRQSQSLSQTSAIETSDGLLSDESDEAAEAYNDLPTDRTLFLSVNSAPRKQDAFSIPLVPNILSTAQKEMLLEMEWAQSAFMQSWAIAIIDNAGTFSNIRTLTISRLPHRHLAILCRRDFWANLPGLTDVSLAVIPDWREVKKEATSWVQDNRVSPSQSIPCVYRLLADYIGATRNITSLHFEWLCGGEYAPGFFARNKLILAAPVVPKAMDMVNRTAVPSILALPYIEHLSLKNCWLSPHIMSGFLSPMTSGSLKSLTFDSVSMTAAIPVDSQPGPLTAQAVLAQQHQPLVNQVQVHAFAVQAGAQVALQHAAQQQAAMNNFQNAAALQNLQNHPAFNVPQPPQPASSDDPRSPDWLKAPRAGSWPELLDLLSPGLTIAEIRFQRDIGPEPKSRKPTRLRKIDFTSCGYVRLPLDFEQVVLDQGQAVGQITTTAPSRRSADLDQFMMKPLESTLGMVVNAFNVMEKTALENVWNMIFGWTNARDELAGDCQADGIPRPGEGRFEGIIEAPNFPPRRRY